jgi:hypothetical protein
MLSGTIGGIMRILARFAGLLLGGCATIAEAAADNLTLEVVPATGTCVLRRQGETLGVSTPDNRIVKVSKSTNDLIFDCRAPGYKNKTESMSLMLSRMNVSRFRLVALGIIDAATGEWKKYPERVKIVLQPLQSVSPRRRK